MHRKPSVNSDNVPTFETPNLSRQTKIFFNEKPVEDFLCVCDTQQRLISTEKIHACVHSISLHMVVCGEKILIISNVLYRDEWKWGDMRTVYPYKFM